jgi:putative tryptophan/tyrosine transport system substrate-binding protein
VRARTTAVLLTSALLAGSGWVGEVLGQTKVARVGVFSFFPITDDPTMKQWFEPFSRSLAAQGWIEGKNVVFEYHNPRSDPSRLADAAAQLVRSNVDVIWASGAPFARAAYAATRTIPIVTQDFTTDPVAEGYAQSYGRPGGNITGVFLDAPEFAGKWFQLLKAMIPDLSRAAVL